MPNLVTLVASQLLLWSALSLDHFMTREQLEDASSKDALCNDGTPPVYYKRINPVSSVWLVHLEGGALCFDI